MRTVKLDAPIGAEIKNIEIAAGLGDAQYRVIREALDEHSVVILRDQEVSPENQLKLAAGIGTPRPLVYSVYSLPDFPDVMVVSNIKENGKHIGIPDAGSLWHSDGAYLAQPDMYSLLYGIEIPQRDGQPLGDTAFTSTWKAYEALPEDLKARLAGRHCVNSFSWHLQKKAALGQLKRAPQTAEQKSAMPDVEHPVVRRHPHTGRPCLFVCEAHTTQLVGMPKDESDELLEFLCKHIVSERFQYRHRWRKGDLVIWDNCAVQHLAHFDYGDLRRRLNRTGTFGPAPVSY